MKRFLSLTTLFFIALLSVTSMFATEVKQEDLKAVEALVDVLSGKIGGFSAQIQETREEFQSMEGNVSALGEKIGGLENQDKFLWQKINALDKSVKSMDIQSIETKLGEIDNMIASIHEDIGSFVGSDYVDEKVWGISQRIKWIEVAISNIKKNIEEKNKDNSLVELGDSLNLSIENIEAQMTQLKSNLDNSYETQGKFQNSLNSALSDVTDMKDMISKRNETVDGKILSLENNDKFLWKKISNLEASLNSMDLEQVNGEIDDLVTIVKGTVEDIDRMVSKEELEESISGINQRLRWVDTLISKLKKSVEAADSSSTVGIESVEERIAELENITETLDSLISGNYEKLAAMLSSNVSFSNSRYGELKSSIDDMGKAVSDNDGNLKDVAAVLNDRYDALNVKVDGNEKQDEAYFQQVNQKIEQLMADLNGKYDALNEKVDGNEKQDEAYFQQVNQKIEQLMADLNDRYDALNEKIDGNEKQDEAYFQQVNQKIEQLMADLNDRYDALNEKIDGNEKQDEVYFQQVNQKIEQLMTDLNDRYDALNEKIDGNEKQDEVYFQQVNQRIDGIESKSAENISSLKKTIDGNLNYVTDMVNDSEARMTAVSNGNKSILENSINSSSESLKAEIKENMDLVKSLIQEDVNSINKRLRWIEIGLKNIKDRLSSNEEKVLEVEKSLNEKIDYNMMQMQSQLNRFNDATNDKINSLGETVEKQNITLNATINEKVWAINKRLRWVDTQIKAIKDNFAEKDSVKQLDTELANLSEKVYEMDLQNAFYVQITDTILVNLGNLQKQTDRLEARVEKISLEYATKDMVEKQIEALDSEMNALQDTLNEKIDTNEKKIRAAVWEINQRIAWIDKAITRIGEEQKIQDSEREALELALNKKIDSKVAAINQRLRWVDKGISSLKINKVDVAEYEKTIDGIQKSKVDNTVFMDTVEQLKQEIFGLDTRVKYLEDTTVRKDVFADFANSTKLSIEKNRMELDAKIMSDRKRIGANETGIADHENRIQSLETRVESLEKGMSSVAQAVNGCLVVGLGIAALGLILANK